MRDMRDMTPDEVQVRRVIVPLDGSPFAAAALPTARALAARTGAGLTAVVVGDATDARRDLVDGEELLVVADGDPARSIVAAAEEHGPSVIVISTRARGRFSGALRGSVARSVLGATRTPLIAVGPQSDRPTWLVGRRRRRRSMAWPEPLSTGDVVVLVDGTAASESAIPAAAAWAAALDTGLTIMTVTEDAPPSARDEPLASFGPRHPSDYVDRLAARTDGAAAHVQRDPIGVASGVRSYLLEHPAALLVLATSAPAGIDRVRAGSTGADVVRAATSPVLVLSRPPAATTEVAA